jgi:very-short-patch-repair endonuclease
MNHIDRTLAALAARQYQVFSRQQTREAGLTTWSLQRRLATGHFIAVGTHALAFAGVTLDWRGGLQAGLLDLGPASVVGGRAAAALHGLDGFDEGPLAFLVERRYRRRTTMGKVRSSAPLLRTDRVVVGGLATLAVPRLIVELAAEVSERELANALDSAQRNGLVTVDRVVRRQAELGRNGRRSVVLDRVLESAGVQSWLERRFLDLVRQAGLPAPHLQRVHRRNGEHVARVDFDWAPAPVIVEVGGRRGYLTVRERQRQERRRNALQTEGKVVYFFTYDDVVDDGGYVLTTLARVLRHRAA